MGYPNNTKSTRYDSLSTTRGNKSQSQENQFQVFTIEKIFLTKNTVINQRKTILGAFSK